MNIWKGAAIAALIALPSLAGAQEGNRADEVETDEIVVMGESATTNATRVVVERLLLVDTATALKAIPGANVNRNGLITGIAQYRGMYGDRVAVDLDGLGVISGGPNAMDSPLSYMSPMITGELVVARGIASVSLAPESIGGHVGTKLSRGEFSDAGPELSGLIGTRYASNGDVRTTAGRLTLATARNRLSLLAEFDEGDDIDTPEGMIRPSGLSRDRHDVSYAFDGDAARLLVFAGQLETTHTGTPALPMDILLIDTSLIGAELGVDITPTVSVEARFSYNDVDHLMDNYSLRSAPMPMMQRLNTTRGQGSQFSVAAAIDRDRSWFRVGIDGISAEHESVITNPANSVFQVNNFTAVSRDLAGVFAEWGLSRSVHDIELGLRVNRVETNAGEVSAAGLMGMMAMNVDQLADAFNGARRDLDWSTVDAVFKYRRAITPTTRWSVELGSKSRAPSYQELYLWLPLQATGGLADGRNYVGNLALNEERSREVVIGFTADNGRFGFSPQVFYRSIRDYIQGVPSTNATANAVAEMMTGVPPLQFSNVDAHIWGADASLRYDLSDRLSLDGVISIVRGRRTDIDDNLYRLSPYSVRVGLTYGSDAWSFRSEVIGNHDQDKVSSYNSEQQTAGYWLANLAGSWSPGAALRVEARIDNVFDESYQDHVAGVNRVQGSGVPAGARLFGARRTVSVGLIYTF